MSRSPVLRLLVGLALILVNLHIALRRLISLLEVPSGAPTAVPFSLDRLADLIRQVGQAFLAATAPYASGKHSPFREVLILKVS